MNTGPASILRVALWQCPPLPLDVEANLARIDAQAQAARARGADLLVCPEMVLSGYDIGAAAVRRLAEPSDGPSARRLASVAKHAGIAIAYGYPERGEETTVYNAAQLVSAEGDVLARCRKTHLYGDLDRSMFAPGAGDERLGVLHGWHVGLAICYDIEFPECARRLALAGADLVLVPTANMEAFDVAPRVLVPARALENQLYVAYANYCGSEGSLRYGGLSCIAPPDGEAPVEAGREEMLLLAEVRHERLVAARRSFTYLQDRRADL